MLLCLPFISPCHMLSAVWFLPHSREPCILSFLLPLISPVLFVWSLSLFLQINTSFPLSKITLYLVLPLTICIFSPSAAGQNDFWEISLPNGLLLLPPQTSCLSSIQEPEAAVLSILETPPPLSFILPPFFFYHLLFFFFLLTPHEMFSIFSSAVSLHEKSLSGYMLLDAKMIWQN